MSLDQRWMRWLLCAALAIGLALVLGPPTLANTPDGETPPEESECDDITDDAAGGLCIAYCEAMDCGSEDQSATDKACERVAARYEALAGEPPPCITPTCFDPNAAGGLGVTAFVAACEAAAVTCPDISCLEIQNAFFSCRICATAGEACAICANDLINLEGCDPVCAGG